MTQKLSEVAEEGKVVFSAGALRQSPFGADVAYVIALWAHTDGDIASILSRMLKADIAVGTAMYLSLANAGAQKSALAAAAKEALPEWQQIILQSIGSVADPWRKERNMFAHYAWGHCSEVSDGILLAHPKVIVNYNISHRQRVTNLPDGRGIIQPKPIDDKQILVYRREDFDSAILHAERARDLYRDFYALLATVGAAGPKAQILADGDVSVRAYQLARERGVDLSSG